MHDLDCVHKDFARLPHAQRVMDHLRIRIREMLLRHGLEVASDRIHLLHGEPAAEIKGLARKLGADLVIVGSHCKNDSWLNLPGATTNCVIQGISSDVMAVKV
jgi:nucleotide-binding universal stress UspA family protein